MLTKPLAFIKRKRRYSSGSRIYKGPTHNSLVLIGHQICKFHDLFDVRLRVSQLATSHKFAIGRIGIVPNEFGTTARSLTR